MRALKNRTLVQSAVEQVGHSTPTQLKKFAPLSIFMKFGTDMDPFKKLSHTNIWLISLVSL